MKPTKKKREVHCCSYGLNVRKGRGVLTLQTHDEENACEKGRTCKVLESIGRTIGVLHLNRNYSLFQTIEGEGIRICPKCQGRFANEGISEESKQQCSCKLPTKRQT